MKNWSILFLKVCVVLMGLMALALATFLTLAFFSGDGDLPGTKPTILFMDIALIPFLIAIFKTLSLLKHIEENTAFSMESVEALKIIRNCAAAISGIYLLGLPAIFSFANADDAPGVVLIGLIIILASSGIAVFAAVLKKLLKNAIDIKSENDLTV